MKYLVLLSFIVSTATFAKNPVIVIETSQGIVEAELFEDKAPVTVKNFLSYVNKKFYDGLIFHRVINNFMIQGGGYDEKFQQKKTNAPIKNEASNGLKNEVGTLAMARTSDPHSATAQFFINVKDNSFLDHTSQTEAGWGYAVFGKVTSGNHVVDRIKVARTGMVAGMGDVPMDTILIKSIRLK